MILSNGIDDFKGDYTSPTDKFLQAYERTTRSAPKKSGNGWTALCPSHDDHRPSLSIDEGEDGRALVNCYGPCTLDAVCAAVGLTVRDLMPAADRLPSPRSNGKPRSRTPAKNFSTADDVVAALERQHGPRSALWTYHDATGQPVGQIVRWDKPDGTKDIRPVALHAEGWQIGGMPEPRPLYSLPDVLGAERVLIVEGEKAADAARSLGLVATTSAHGAKSAAKTDWSPLAGKECFVFPDNDDPGSAYADEVVALLAKLSPASVVRVVKIENLPDGSPMPKGGDIVDWIDSHGDAAEPESMAAELVAFSEAAEVARPDSKAKLSVDSWRPTLVCMADVEPRSIRWLWPQRIALGRLTLLVGMPGAGKSFLTCDMASRVSTGTPWPDGTLCEQGSVIFITAEDDPDDTIRPRLDAHRADVSQVHLLSGMERTENGKTAELMFTLADVDILEQALQEVSDCKLVVIDPVGSFLGGRTDAHRDNEVRGVLAPIAKLAAEYGAAVLVIAHRRKATSSMADDMALGSRAFTGIARSVWHLSPDKEDKRRRLFLPGKCNLSAEQTGLAFTIAGEPAAVHWERDPVAMNADEALALESGEVGQGSALDEAVCWLGDCLSEGSKPGNDVKSAARADGIAPRTLDRAKAKLGVVNGPQGFRGPWVWKLPDTDIVRQDFPEFANDEVLADCAESGGLCADDGLAATIRSGKG